MAVPMAGGMMPPGMEASSKGLRQFSRQVWMKVMEKKKTTYNEVADELVEEFRQERLSSAGKIGMGMGGTEYMGNSSGKDSNPALEERNVRRRVYDALNVLMALGIIVKDRKMITWKGLPSNSADEVIGLEREFEARRTSLVNKRRQVRDLILQQLAFRRLVQRNKMQEQENRRQNLHTDHSAEEDGVLDGDEADSEFPSVPGRPRSVIHLPLITLSSPDTATITLELVAPQRQVATMQFDAPFQVHDDKELIRQMNLHEFPEYHLKKLLPPHLQRYLLQDILEPPITRDSSIAHIGGGAASKASHGGVGIDNSRPVDLVDRVAEAMRNAASGAASHMINSGATSAAGSILAGSGVAVGPPELPAIILGPGMSGARLFLPTSAAVEVATRLMGCLGLSTPPPAWREQHQAAVARGAVPVLGMPSGWDKQAMLSLLSASLRHLGGLLNDRGGFAATERIGTAVQSASLSLTRDSTLIAAAAAAGASSASAASAVAAAAGSSGSAPGGGSIFQVPREVQVWATKLLEAVGGYLIVEGRMKEILQEHITARTAKHTAQRQAANELVMKYKALILAAGHADTQSALINEFKAHQHAFNTTAQAEWDNLLARNRSSLALIEAELVGQTLTLLAAGWLPDPSAMVEGQASHTAALTLSMNTYLNAAKQLAQQGIQVPGNSILPAAGPGPCLLAASPGQPLAVPTAPGGAAAAAGLAGRPLLPLPALPAANAAAVAALAAKVSASAAGAAAGAAGTNAGAGAAPLAGAGAGGAVNPMQAFMLLQAMASAQAQKQGAAAPAPGAPPAAAAAGAAAPAAAPPATGAPSGPSTAPAAPAAAAAGATGAGAAAAGAPKAASQDLLRIMQGLLQKKDGAAPAPPAAAGVAPAPPVAPAPSKAGSK